MRVAIIDDERRIRDELSGYVEQYARENNILLETVTFPSGDALLASGYADIDILIFDIDMPGTNGMDAARQIRSQNDTVVIMFITNVAQYAINGYEVDAVDYVIKPIGYYDFAMKFRKAVRSAGRNRSSSLVIDSLDGPVSLNVQDILYVEVMAHYLIYHTATVDYRVRASMKDHEDLLRSYHFARCHKSYLINLSKVTGVHSADVLVGDLSIPIGRAFKESLLSDYIRFLNR